MFHMKTSFFFEKMVFYFEKFVFFYVFSIVVTVKGKLDQNMATLEMSKNAGLFMISHSFA